MSQLATYGFRVVGSPFETRRPVTAAVAFSAHAACDPKAETHRECYLSAFQFGEDFREHWEANDTTKGFNGLCWARWLWFDIDRDNLDDALDGARRLAAFVVDRYGLDADDLLAFFSGSKGFHIGLPLSLCGDLRPSGEFNKVCRRLAEGLAGAAEVTIDSGVFDKVRLFRAPNSTHAKTSLHKRRLSFDELLSLKTSAIAGLAAAPAVFDVPGTPPATPQAATDWTEAAESLNRQTIAVRDRQASLLAEGCPSRLNRGTLEFIRDGAATGDRHRLLFSAAANLAEQGCPPDLAHALLTESALDSGLSPNEVRRQIDCGHSHGSEENS
ncbi:MAG: DNA primase [Planctomycetota bacterium]|nr:DNA primase [Planctomycetota bacterium]